MLGVKSFVLKILISFTEPISPCTSITSSILKGLNKIISIPPAKFESDPCKANPIAKPAAPNIATNDDVSIPNLAITVIKSKIRNAQKTRLPKKFARVISIFLLIITLLKAFVVMLISQSPIRSKRIAIISFGEYSIIRFNIKFR